MHGTNSSLGFIEVVHQWSWNMPHDQCPIETWLYKIDNVTYIVTGSNNNIQNTLYTISHNVGYTFLLQKRYI